MKRSRKLALLGMLCLAAAVALGIAWLIICTATGIGLVMNGPWLVALLAAGVGAGFGFASCLEEAKELREEQQLRSAETSRIFR